MSIYQKIITMIIFFSMKIMPLSMVMTMKMCMRRMFITMAKSLTPGLRPDRATIKSWCTAPQCLWPKLNKYKFDAWLHKDISHMKFMAACIWDGDKKYSCEKYIWQNLTPFFKRMGNRWIFRRLVFAIGAGASLDNVTTRLWKRTDVILLFSTFRQRKLFLYFFHKSQHTNIF